MLWRLLEMRYKNLAEIFKTEMPRGVGKWARGDAVLWKKFAEYYTKNEYAYNKDTFIDDFSRIFQEITEKELLKDNCYYIKNFDIGHGLSSGEIATNYWLDIVIPYVLDNME